jgi:glucokinase
MIVGGDVGGTKTLLGLFDVGPAETGHYRTAAHRPRVIATYSYATSDYGSIGEILDEFRRAVGPLSVEAAAIGVAGPVVGNAAKLTNISWGINAREIAAGLGTTRVQILNDLEALANGVTVLTADEVCVLQAGVPRADGNAAVIAAGTGLGQALLYRVGGRLRPVASEGGHADFAARTDREIELVRMLRERYGRAEVEQVLSGPGLVNLHRFTHRGGECEMFVGLAETDVPPRITQAALSGRCQQCADALRMFVSAYGAEAGNLALRGMATSGLYVGGGIAPKILPALQTGQFMDAFLAKEPMRELLERIAVTVILNQEAGLLGAAVHAHELAAGHA